MEVLLWLAPPFLVAGGICYFLAFRYGPGGGLLLFLLSPVAIYFIARFSLNYVWDPNPGCTESCIGRLAYVGLGGAAIAGAETGTLAGTAAWWLHARRQRAISN